VVSGLLLPVPILLLNVFALRVLGDQLRQEQRQAGELALQSAQRVLGEYILALDPGFGVETILDDELLSWLSRVVHHEINLYWGSKVYASSKSELFSTGLLPKRIPGEIYSELVLGGSSSASRVNRAGRIDYLELYAPLTIPGQSSSPNRLFLSVPLLAQQVETAERLASLQRRVLLATAALVLLLAAVGGRLVRGFTAPLMEIVDGTQRIAAGARSIELNPADEELATLVRAIDRMAGKIAEGRRKLLSEKALVERVIDNVTSGVVSLDDERRVVLLNQVARELLQAEVGDSMSEVLGRNDRLSPVADFLEASSGEARFKTVQLPREDGEAEEWTLVWVPLPGPGDPTSLFVVEDVTEVLRGQRLQAWAEMARIIAHETKNPLTPIRLSTEHLREVWSERPDEFNRVFDRCTANILEQVDELQQISSEFSAYSRLPKIEPREGDLGEEVARIVEGYRASDPERIRLEVDPALARAATRFDAKLIGRALRNLIENALRASSDGEQVRVSVETNGERASIRVLDSGPGVGADVLPKIFDPYFSTHDSGTGLGLPIARRIAEEHGGGIHARNREQGGLEVELWIPAA
jgi:two-component system nitrogen regulation sensor histidine kinase NtrY